MALKKTASSTIKKLYNKASQNYSAKLAGSKSLLYNKYVLYVSFIICFMNLLIWMFSGEFVHVAVFLLVGYLTSRFSKNMIVILVISLVVSNVFKSGSNIVLEGMESKESKASKESTESTEGNETKEDSEESLYHSKGEGKKKEGMSREGVGKKKMKQKITKVSTIHMKALMKLNLLAPQIQTVKKDICVIANLLVYLNK